MAGGFKCELCGAVFEGRHAKENFTDHVYQHEHREAGYGTLRTRFNTQDRTTLKVNKILNDFEDEDAA